MSRRFQLPARDETRQRRNHDQPPQSPVHQNLLLPVENDLFTATEKPYVLSRHTCVWQASYLILKSDWEVGLSQMAALGIACGCNQD